MLLSPDWERKMGSVGPLLASLEARIVVDDEGEIDAKEEQVGELWIRGYAVMKARSSISRTRFVTGIGLSEQSISHKSFNYRGWVV